MKAIVLVCALVLAFAAPRPEELTPSYRYDEFAREFRPTLKRGSPEWRRRERVFRRNLMRVLTHNHNKAAKWSMGVNKFLDWDPVEFKRMRRYLPAANLVAASGATLVQNITVPAGFVAPASVDWRTRNVLSAIKNQGDCGGCWAFAATEAIESSAAITNHSAPLTLSVEQILDCTPNPHNCGGSGGCNGATAELAFSYAIGSGGITSDSLLPWSGGATCSFSPSSTPPAVKVTSYQQLKSNDRAAVVYALSTFGPVTIGVDASTWQFYNSGVSTSCNSEGPLTLDHAVQLVGYNTNADGSLTWIVRNSWGAEWGENGFIRLADTNACVRDPDPSAGNGCDGGPPTVSVCGPCGLFYEVSWPTAYVLP